MDPNLIVEGRNILPALSDLVAIEPAVLVKIVITVSVQVIGVVEFLKNFINTKKAGNKTYAILSLLVTCTCAIMNTPLVSHFTTAIFNIVVLSLAVTQCGYQVIVKAIPRALESIVNKSLGGKDG